MTSVTIVNFVVSMFVVGSIPFFLMGINRELTEKSIYSKSKTQLLKVFIIGITGLVSVFIGSILCMYAPINNVVEMYDLAYSLPFVGGVGSFVLFIATAFVFLFITLAGSSDNE